MKNKLIKFIEVKKAKIKKIFNINSSNTISKIIIWNQEDV